MKNTAYALSSAVVLFVFWLLLSGYFTVFLVTMGALSAVAIVALGRRMEVIDREGHPIDMGWRVLTYWPWLVKEIAKSAWDVACIIVDPRLPISPRLVRAKTTQKTAVGVVTYANSITLTPGTISVDVREGEILVHALTRESAAGVLEGEMDRRVTRFEGRS
ncbi:MAG TPA: Na+/H+ antiporter subunit E [Burkholderiales bacterium]|jgi:multicomponent Na+:H+ antiporter subunit E